MQRKTFQWIVIFIIMMGLTSLACSAFSGGDEPVAEVPTAVTEAVIPEPDDTEAESEPAEAPAEPEEMPAEEAAPEEEPPAPEPEESQEEESGEEEMAEAPEAQAKSLAISSIPAISDVSSYRMVVDASLSTNDDTGAELTQAFVINLAVSNDPEGMSLTMTAEGIEGSEEFSGLAMTQVDGITYMTLPELGCITTSEGDAFGADNPFAELTDTNTFMEDIDEADFEGEEVVNGIETLHYSFDESSFDSPDQEIEWAEGHIYVAKEGGYLVRMTMEGEGIFDEVADVPEYGTIDLQIDITDLNQPVDLVIPAECEGEGAGGTDWPMMEDAFNVSSIGGFLTYQTNMPFEDVLNFYQDALLADGWEESPDETFILQDTAIITLYRGNESLNLSIVREDTGSDTLSVLIVSE